MSTIDKRIEKHPCKKLPKGSKYCHPVATTLTGIAAEKGRKLRDEHAIGLATIVRAAVIKTINDHYMRVESGLGEDLKSPSVELFTSKSRKATKLNVATQIDKKTFTLLRRLKKKTHVCAAQLIRQPVIDEITSRYEKVIK